MLETAKELSLVVSHWSLGQRYIFRAGVWKPRTSPRSFQGAGEEGLRWLQDVKETFGMAVATEVATPDHVRLAMDAGIDYLWIGARTSANPLAVQAIADSIKDCSLKGIFIKNPVNADAELWLGNIERLEKTGVPVIAVHRGCGHKPCWSMAHTVRIARPDIPMLLDPSHMSGDATQVPVLLKKVDELGLDGAMIEVHIDPEHALSDSKQQLSPDALRVILGEQLTNNQRITNEQLTVESRLSADANELNWFRAEIDELDETLWTTIAARMDVSKRIGEWKKEHGVAPLQPERYKEIVERLKTKSEELGIPADFVQHVWELIHEQSLYQQS